MSLLDFNRPDTPQSPSTNSLYDATTTIDDITAALAKFSRVPSPEPPSAVVCCCPKENCENLKSWLTSKSRLESRLVLSAGKRQNIFFTTHWKPHLKMSCLEVGQALLQRHEAYVRQHEVYDSLSNPTTDSHYLIQRKWNTFLYSQHQDNATTDIQSTNEDLDLELETLTKEKAQLEKVSIALIVGKLLLLYRRPLYL